MVGEFIDPDLFQEIVYKQAGTLGGAELPELYQRYYGVPTRGSFHATSIEFNLQLTVQLLYVVQALMSEV